MNANYHTGEQLHNDFFGFGWLCSGRCLRAPMAVRAFGRVLTQEAQGAQLCVLGCLFSRCVNLHGLAGGLSISSQIDFDNSAIISNDIANGRCWEINPFQVIRRAA